MYEAIGLDIERQTADDPARILEVIKQEMHEMSKQEAKIVDLGTLSGGEHEHLWRGNISLKRRLDSGEITEQEVEARTSRLNEFFVQVSKGAPKRCVDGSTIQGYDDHDPEWFGRPLGPQEQGGTVDEAIALRLVRGIEPDATLDKDIDELVDNSKSDFAPGGHTDNEVSGQDRTGCGAVDGQSRKLRLYNDQEASAFIEEKANVLWRLAGAESKAGAFQRLQKPAEQLLELKDYFPTGWGILNKMHSINPKGVEKLIRPHPEVSLTINLLKGTTFHRDHYNAETNGEIGNFNLDAWNFFEEFSEEEAYALMADAVATLMDLTDGSLRLFARLPVKEVVEAA
jgi:hypothetical protein